MSRKKIIHVVGARPNFMKIAPILRQMKYYPDQFENIRVHTGQHYDDKMSRVFFEELELPRPDRYLGVGSGSHAEQTARVMVEFEKVLIEMEPDLVVVVGDVNSTVACSLTSVKRGIPVAHVEAGLRSFDRTMPEEINRIITDQISDYLFVTEKSAQINLRNEGVSPDKVHFVGNVMIDSLIHLLPKAQERWESVAEEYDLLQSTGKVKPYILVTLHRPSNVDRPESLSQILKAFEILSQNYQILFPVHPRTRNQISEQQSLVAQNGNLLCLDPLGYLDFLCLMDRASLVLTDSGGIQEETTFLKRPCLTLRKNTERPITLEIGTNQLIPLDCSSIVDNSNKILSAETDQTSSIPELWDGKASKRIIEVLSDRM
jgi:UDP-N-acetylglucosamine 2-epimerase (non-hydrolysing)